MTTLTHIYRWRPFQTSSTFKFVNPENGRVLEAESYPKLVHLILAYRRNNSYDEIENLPAVVDHYLCGLPENTGRCYAEDTLERGFTATIKGGIALIKSMLYQSFVQQDVADARSVTCSTCPNNKFYDKGPFVAWCDKVAVASVGKRRSSCHAQLGVCSVCECPLAAKVFYSGKIDLTPEQVLSMHAVSCWQPDANKEA